MSYPANVYNGDTPNRQQIATILQSMGFETDDIAKAFNIFDRNYGDKKYDVSVLTEIVFQVQQNNVHGDDANDDTDAHAYDHHEHYEEDNNQQQSHSAPSTPPQHNHPQPPSAPHNALAHSGPQQYIAPPPPPQPSTNDISDIFQSLEENNNRLKVKAQSASPQLHAHPRHIHKRASKEKKKKKAKAMDDEESKLDLLSCCESFDKYANDENEILDVLIQTVANNDNNDFNNLVNWNDLYNNIKQRKHKWHEYQSQFNSSALWQSYNEQKHKQIAQNLRNHKAQKHRKQKRKDNETPKTPQCNDDESEHEEEKHSDADSAGNVSLLQKALQYEHDCKKYELLTKKDKLLITANTYSILKTNKEKTELMISKCNEKMEELNRRMLEIQNEKKQYFSALMRTKNKLLFQIQSIRETEISIKELHEETNKISNEIAMIRKTKQSVDKFECGLQKISNTLKSNFNEQLEPTWREWNNREVLIWLKHTENEKFAANTDFLSSIQESNVCGKDLPQMNDFILRSFKMNLKTDRDLLLQNIQRIVHLEANWKKAKKHKTSADHNDGNTSDSNSKQLCVICSDGEANHIMIPCGQDRKSVV